MSDRQGGTTACRSRSRVQPRRPRPRAPPARPLAGTSGSLGTASGASVAPGCSVPSRTGGDASRGGCSGSSSCSWSPWCRSSSRAATCAVSGSTRCSSCCSRSASTWWWAGAACSTSATSRSSASGHTPTRCSARTSSTSICRRSWRSRSWSSAPALLGLLVGLPVAAALGRLPRDRHALLLPDLPQHPRSTATNLRREPHRRRQRDLERRPAELLRPRAPVSARGRFQRRLLLRGARVLRRRPRRAPLRQRLPHRASVAGAARGLARRGADGHAGQLAQAARLRVRRRGAGLTGHAVRVAQRRRLPETSSSRS